MFNYGDLSDKLQDVFTKRKNNHPFSKLFYCAMGEKETAKAIYLLVCLKKEFSRQKCFLMRIKFCHNSHTEKQSDISSGVVDELSIMEC